MLAFFKGKSFISRMIKWRTWGVYSHVAWIEPNGTIYESWHRKDPVTGHNGPRAGFVGDLHKGGTEVDLFEIKGMSINERDAFLTMLKMDIESGKFRYDFKGVSGGFMLRREQSEEDDFVFCSDWLMHNLTELGIRLLDRVPSWQVSPSEMSHSPLLEPVGKYYTGDDWAEFMKGVSI